MCKSHELFPEIPYELQIEILMRLPVKSLMRFKSVSKVWSSLISSQYFTDRFLNVSSSPLRIYVWFENSPNEKVLLSALSSPDSDLSSFVIDQEFTIPAMEGYSVSHVYRGLICFANRTHAQIYNTSTRQLVVLPEIEVIGEDDHYKMKIIYGIGHNSVHNQYKVVCTVSGPNVMTEIWVLLLGGDCCSRWKKISSPFQPHYRLTQGLTINGRSIHYVAWDRLFNLVLVSFDIRSEEISIHQEGYPAFCRLSVHLIEYGGRVALLDYSTLGYKGVMKLWVMKNAEKKLSWSGKTLVLHPSQMNIIQDIDLKVHGTTPNGEVIFVPTKGKIIDKSQSNVFLYNLQNNLLRKVIIKETLKRHRVKYWDLIGFNDVENLMCL